MRSIFDILIKLIVPFSVIWFTFPIIKRILGIDKGDDKPKKKKNYRPEIRAMRQSPPPRPIPQSHKDSMRSLRQDVHSKHERMLTQIKLLSDWPEKENLTESPEKGNMRNITTEKPTPKSAPQKKKHFTKGVDPDFL